jgi:hypothetical protein
MGTLLLPFTHGIDGQAISCALSLASQCEADLLLVPLVCPRRGKRSQEVLRPEDIQQALDFLVYTQQRARRMGISTRQSQIHTRHPVQSIRAFAREMACEGILLFLRGGKGVLLETEEVKQLLEDRHIPLYVANLAETRFRLSAWWPTWLGGRRAKA